MDVSENRIAALLKKNLITETQARQFRQEGAIGSHLENLERNDGFKGFNQKGVSEIISATDPRKNPMSAKTPRARRADQPRRSRTHEEILGLQLDLPHVRRSHFLFR